MKILFVSDIFGRPGRETVKEILPKIKEKHGPDLVIANAENLAHGNGFSPEHINEMSRAGVDFFTSGNHVWGNLDGVNRLDDKDFPVIRPANFPIDMHIPGRGSQVIKDKQGRKLLVINLMGRVFMKPVLDCPFRAADRIIKEHQDEDLAGIFVDFHAETTSEKYALSFYLDGKVSAIVGTHTHVPTKDARILTGGTAAITDVGMTGSVDSIIGVKRELIINHFLSNMPAKHEPEENGEMVFNAVLVELDDGKNKALNITHIQEFLHSK